MRSEVMLPWLESLDLEQCLPVWTISYGRAGQAPWLDLVSRTFPRPDLVNVLVRQSQLDAYRAAYPAVTVHALPDEDLLGCGTTRWAAAQLARSMGHSAVIMTDDDVLRLDAKVQGAIQRGPNAGKECSTSTSKPQSDQLSQHMLTAISMVARDVWAEHPEAMLGGLCKRHMSFDVKNHRTKYLLNGGATPRQVTVWHLDRMEAAGVFARRDWWLERFAITGEDIGWTAEVLLNDGDVWVTPSFVFDHWPESVNIQTSTIRSPETAAAQHAHDYESIGLYPAHIRDGFKWTRSIIDGSPQWGDVAWRTMGKLRKRPTQAFLWDEAAVLDSLLDPEDVLGDLL